MRTIGIDLGTTNTVASIDGNIVQHASGLETSAILPSVVAFPPSGATLVGVTARKRRAIDPKNTIYSAKRVIGQRWLAYSATKFRKEYPFDMVEAAGGTCAFQTRAGMLTPVDIAARIIDKLFAGHSMLRNEVRAVVSVPAAFDEDARRATVEAAEQAGLSHVDLVEEPVATAMAYVTMRSERARYAAVYDLGGGTFDLALIDCSVNPARVIRHAGDPYLGGDDIDRAIAEWVAGQVLERFGWELDNDSEVRDRLLVECEQAKIRLTTEPTTEIELARVDPAAPQAAERITLDQDVVNGLVQDLVTRTFILCDQVLRDAQLSPSQIDVVYLAGGTTRMPLVQHGVAHYFGSLPRVEFDPMQVVAMGAGLVAH